MITTISNTATAQGHPARRPPKILPTVEFAPGPTTARYTIDAGMVTNIPPKPNIKPIRISRHDQCSRRSARDRCPAGS